MKSLWLKLLPLVSLGLFLAACTTTKLGGFRMDVVGFRYDPSAVEGKRTSVELVFNNDNVLPVAISSSQHKLYLNGTYVGKAGTREALGSPQLSSVTQILPVTFENTAFVQNLVASGAPSVDYRLDSVLSIQSNEDKLTIKSSSTGSVDLTGLKGLR